MNDLDDIANEVYDAFPEDRIETDFDPSTKSLTFRRILKSDDVMATEWKVIEYRVNAHQFQDVVSTTALTASIIKGLGGDVHS